MIERLLLMLKDTDYRVRLFLARRIGILFQTWDGHEELFQDIWWVALQMILLVKAYFILFLFLFLFFFLQILVYVDCFTASSSFFCDIVVVLELLNFW